MPWSMSRRGSSRKPSGLGRCRSCCRGAQDCEIAELVSAGLDTIALRAPAHPVARALLAESSLPIAAPSANRSGRISPTLAAHVEAELGDLPAMILDGGPCARGLESTVVGVVGDQTTLLRVGALPREEIEAVLGHCLAMPGPKAKISFARASLESHYAPQMPLRLDVVAPRNGEALLAFGPDAPDFAGPTINLSSRGDLAEAAVNFFAALRTLDASGARAIAVMPIPGTWSRRSHQRPLARAPPPLIPASASPCQAIASRPKPPRPRPLDALVRIVGEEHAIRDAARDGALSRRMARPLSRQGGASAEAGLDARGLGDPGARQRTRHGHRAARRQYRLGRRTNSLRER